MGHKLILASASLRRKELLEQIGADFKVLAAKGEETAMSTKPERLVSLGSSRELASGCR